eukprot:10180700-Karenia_brevis.AAC.1
MVRREVEYILSEGSGKGVLDPFERGGELKMLVTPSMWGLIDMLHEVENSLASSGLLIGLDDDKCAYTVFPKTDVVLCDIILRNGTLKADPD